MNNNKALLIIDMQKGSFTDKIHRFDTKGVVNRINSLAKQFRDSNSPVIYIQHDGTVGNAFLPNTSDWEILDELEVEQGDIRMNKYANDVFYNTNLKSLLTELKVSDLFITGCATDFCVESTIQSALTKDYEVTVVSDAHTTGNRPHLSAEKVIEHYNWVWQNMIPTKGKITVSTFKDLQN